jgi:pimeloyl-ACP methyl ester carboxylesterase
MKPPAGGLEEVDWRRMVRIYKRCLALTVVLVASVLLAGCSAGGKSVHPANAGSVSVRVTVPAEPRAIDQTAFVPLGSLDQWISIRGEDRGNPVLLVVHGGPGEAQWPEAAHYRAWENAFTVVQWDQRGAGHTYGRYGAKTPDMTLDRISQDGIELAEYLCRTLGKKKIIVLGHSWGSTVAVAMVQRRPELFAAYVGTGQVGSWKGAIKVKFDLALAKARADGDEATVNQLLASGPPDPKDANKVFAFNDRVHPLWPPSDVAWIKSLRAEAPALKAADPKNFKDFREGFGFSAEKVVPDQIAADLPATASRIGTAFFVIQGRGDLITPTADAVAYFNGVTAPYKKLVLIPDAGHFAFMTAPDAFLGALVDEVRPVAVERGA